MIKLPKGTTIVCVTKKIPSVVVTPSWITIGKEYILTRDHMDTDNWFNIINDDGRHAQLNKGYFDTLDAIRRQTIKDIIDG